MKHLQWFPGHMTAAMRMMEENLKAVDGVMIVLDARAPRASLNSKLDKLFVNKNTQKNMLFFYIYYKFKKTIEKSLLKCYNNSIILMELSI